MATNEPRVLLIDDLRSFVDGRRAEVARTSAAGVTLLSRHRHERVDELWLDHDLGGDDTIWPVVELLERAAFDGEPFDVGLITIHSANPAGHPTRHCALPPPAFTRRSRRYRFIRGVSAAPPDRAVPRRPPHRPTGARNHPRRSWSCGAPQRRIQPLWATTGPRSARRHSRAGRGRRGRAGGAGRSEAERAG